MFHLLTVAGNLDSTKLSTYEWILGAVLIVSALLIIFVVLLQEGRQSNVGVISGAADSFMDKGAAKSLDQKLSKWTKYIAIIFFLLVLAAFFVTHYLSNEARNQKAYEESLKTATSTSTTVSSAATTTTTTVADKTEDAGDSDTAEKNDNASEENKEVTE